MADERLAEIRARVDATTTGPWAVRDLYVIAPGDVHIADFEWLADTDKEWAEFKANATFTAAARQDVPALLAEVERLRAEERLFVGVVNERDQALRERNEARAERDEARAELATAVEERDAARLVSKGRMMQEHDAIELAERVQRVRDLHSREQRGDRPVCGACLDAYEEPLAWPCPTIAALDRTEADR